MPAIECYMLRVEPRQTHTALVTAKDGKSSPCNGRPGHRAEIPVDESTTFADIRERLLPVKCMYCGRHEFTVENSDVAISHSENVYINPVTGVISHNVRVAAAPGAMWYCPWLVDEGDDRAALSGFLSEEYIRDWLGKRPPIAVMLPGGSEWIVDQCAAGKKTGWTVRGIEPKLTASPSIDAPRYHGFLQDGMLTPPL